MNKTYSLDHPQKGLIQYTDKKRYWWMLSLFMPVFPLLGIWLYFNFGQEWMLAIPLLVNYTLMPVIDHLVGPDENNPPEEIVPQLENDHYYRWLTWATVPMHFLVLIVIAVFVGTQDLSMISVVVMAITVMLRHPKIRPARAWGNLFTASCCGKFPALLCAAGIPKRHVCKGWASPYGASLRSSRKSDAPLPKSAQLRGYSAVAQWLLRHVSAGLCAVVMVPDNGQASVGTAAHQG